MKAKKRNKKKFIYIVTFAIMFLTAEAVYAQTSSKINFCDYSGVRRTFMIIGIILNLIKIIVPILITIMAMVGFTKTVISGKTDDLKANLMQVVKQLVAGLIIFCIPGLLDFAFDSLVTTDNSNFLQCTNCLLDTDHCTIPDKDPDTYTKD